MKTTVLEIIGETALSPPARLNAALAANDRLKYRFSLLQLAAAHADHPARPPASLRRERLGCGIDDEGLDAVVSASARDADAYHVPGAAKLLRQIAEEVRVMAAPILAAAPARADAAGLARRTDALLAALPEAAEDRLPPGAIEAITRAAQDGADSLHQLVMDLHKRLNALQAELAEEVIDGANAYGLADEDRPLVAAFMAGLNRTARLKFNHPGLATTATRSDGRLLIQNDIGTTDAHVIVIRVRNRTLSVTYSDVHPERLAFFQAMLAAYPFAWQTDAGGVLGGMAFQLATGILHAADAAACADALGFLGSRLVFLIDWNRARKQLRGFLRGADRIALLAWAAEQELGHRGFLELGGARLVHQAIESCAGSAMHFGDRLCDVLGDEEALAFLRFVLRATAEGLLAGQSQALVRDRIRAALAQHFSNEEHRLLALAADHAGLVFELATLVRDALREPEAATARRARRFEHDADQLVIAAREAVRRRPDHAVFRLLLEAADDAADQLEDVAFLLGLGSPAGETANALHALADLLGEAAQEWIKALGDAAVLGRGGRAEEAEDFLAAIDRIGVIEHEADDAERALAAAAIRDAADFRALHLVVSMGRALEAASDALKRGGLILREHVLGEVLGG